MPSEKPDTKEISALRKKRGIYHVEPCAELYSDLHARCLVAVEDGYTSQQRAITLLNYLKSTPKTAKIYPNNILEIFLDMACQSEKNWTPEVEHDLIHFIYSLYIGYDSTPHDDKPPRDLSYTLPHLKLKSDELKSMIFSMHLDSLTEPISLVDKFVGFTGKFEFGSRAKCFAEARKRGAVPCDPAPYMEYLFVSREFEEYGAISSKIDGAIYCRRVYGSPRILREKDWNIIIGQ